MDFIIFKVFRWYTTNKDWLTHPRLPRMMKRLLRRAATLNPGESDDFADDSSSSSSSSTNPIVVSAGIGNAAELEQRLEALEQLKKIDWTELEKRIVQSVNASLQSQQDQWTLQANQTNQSLQHVMAGSSELAMRISKAEKMIQTTLTIKNALGNSSRSRTNPEKDEEGSIISATTNDEMLRIKHSLENEMEQIMLKMQLTASDLEKSINTVQMSSESALRNFSQTYRDGMSQLTTLLDDRLTTASSSSYDVITNATQAFGEDVQLLRQAVSSSASQIQFLVGQDLKTTRGLEEIRTGNRRHEGHIQQLTSQFGDFKNQVQDQLNSIRTHFTQTVNEFYNKIVERQNSMSYRLASIVDDLIGVKNRGNIFT